MGQDDAAAAEANLVAAMRIWAGAADEGETEDIDGCTFVRCEAELRAFNQVLVRRRPEDLGRVVAMTREYFRGVQGRFRLRIRDDEEPVEDDPFVAGGLARNGGIPSLSAPLSATEVKSALDVRRVTDEATLADHIEVVAAAFEWDTEELAMVFRPRIIDTGGWYAYVGYDGDSPVTTTQLVLAGGVGGLYYVGTAEAARGRGWGEAITRHAMAEAASLGCGTVTLQASPMGLPIYEHIGFRRVAYYRTFVAAAG